MVPQGLSEALDQETREEDRVHSVQQVCSTVQCKAVEHLVEVLLERSFLIASIDASC